MLQSKHRSNWKHLRNILPRRNTPIPPENLVFSRQPWPYLSGPPPTWPNSVGGRVAICSFAKRCAGPSQKRHLIYAAQNTSPRGNGVEQATTKSLHKGSPHVCFPLEVAVWWTSSLTRAVGNHKRKQRQLADVPTAGSLAFF